MSLHVYFCYDKQPQLKFTTQKQINIKKGSEMYIEILLTFPPVPYTPENHHQN